MDGADHDLALNFGQLPKPGRPAAGQDQTKRDQILSGAHRVFTRMGFDAAAMNDITREAQVSKGTIYVYFTSKEELFEALIERERSQLCARIDAAFATEGEMAVKLRALSEAIIRVSCSDTVIRAHRIVIGVSERMPELGLRFFDRGAARTVRLLTDYLAAEGAHLTIPDPAFAAAQFVELSSAGLFRRRLFGQMPEPPTEAEIARNAGTTVAMFLNFYAV